MLGREDRKLCLAREAHEARDGLHARRDACSLQLGGAILGHSSRVGRARKPRPYRLDDMADMLADIVDRQFRQNLLLGHGSPTIE